MSTEIMLTETMPTGRNTGMRTKGISRKNTITRSMPTGIRTEITRRKNTITGSMPIITMACTFLRSRR